MNDVADKQNQVREFWDNKPCDSELSGQSAKSESFYKEIETKRYQYQHHILDILDSVSWQGKSVLEIGTGVGTDARQIISRGGKYTGINVDEGSVSMTKNALMLFGLDGEVLQCSATDMVFEDNRFDVVYSFGVLHHIPGIEKAMQEVRRVLKPGGELLFMLYNKDSINYRIEIKYLRKFVLRLLNIPGVIKFFGFLGFPEDKLTRHAEIYRQYGKLGEQEWLNRNTDGPDSPYSKVYDQKDVEEILEGFDILNTRIDYFDYRHWGVLGRMLPSGLVRHLSKRWGWHRTVYARRVAG